MIESYRRCRSIALLGFFALAWVGLAAQSAKQTVPANLLIPQPPPSAPLSDWVSAAEHSRIQLAVPDAELRGWDYPAPQSTDATSHSHDSRPGTPLLLFFNGNGMVVDRSQSLYRSLEGTGAEVVVYDYRGIGFSAGTPDVMAFRQDSLRVYDAVVAAHPGRPVAVYGFSLGTAMASYVASQRPVAGLILAGTIATADDEFPVYMRMIGVSPSEIARLQPAANAVEAFDEVANVRRSQAPLLMLHGEDDSLVPIAEGRKVFAASPAAQKRFVALPGVGHNGTADSAESLNALKTFLRTLRTSPGPASIARPQD